MKREKITITDINAEGIPPLNGDAKQRPEFIRLPQPGMRCALTGLSRSYINQMILPCQQNGFKPPVRSFVMRQRGAKTGVRLIDYSSLREYILRHEQERLSGSSQVETL